MYTKVLWIKEEYLHLLAALCVIYPSEKEALGVIALEIAPES
jgi:hypothetical protein